MCFIRRHMLAINIVLYTDSTIYQKFSRNKETIHKKHFIEHVSLSMKMNEVHKFFV